VPAETPQNQSRPLETEFVKFKGIAIMLGTNYHKFYMNHMDISVLLKSLQCWQADGKIH